MEKYDTYYDIANRTNGDIYIGVVGPVRTGKSTFITKFMEKFVIPNIGNKLQRQIATDEMPQSADGKTIMTTQPKFVPANSVKVQFKNKSTANVRLVDCVGYLIDGVSGDKEDDKPRLVKTPWSDKEMTFEKAAELGTRKVIEEYSTIGIVVTTDGSFTDISREKYQPAEEKVIKELKKKGNPFIVIMNTKTPKSEYTMKLCDDLEEKYGVSVICYDVLNLSADDINEIIEKVLFEFPMYGFNVDIPEWMQALPSNNKIIDEILQEVKRSSGKMRKMRDFSEIFDCFSQSENLESPELLELKLGEGIPRYKIQAKDGVYYKVLSEECGEKIDNDCDLMCYIKSFSESKRKFGKIREALEEAENGGYGVVLPTLDEFNLEEPVLVKQGGKYGVKLKASAPSLHIVRVDVATEVSPIVGTEKQGEDLVNYIMTNFEDNPSGIWETNMFGKSMQDLVKEGLDGKLNAMPKNAQDKMRKTLTRIVNENRGGVICILL